MIALTWLCIVPQRLYMTVARGRYVAMAFGLLLLLFSGSLCIITI